MFGQKKGTRQNFKISLSTIPRTSTPFSSALCSHAVTLIKVDTLCLTNFVQVSEGSTRKTLHGMRLSAAEGSQAVHTIHLLCWGVDGFGRLPFLTLKETCLAGHTCAHGCKLEIKQLQCRQMAREAEGKRKITPLRSVTVIFLARHELAYFLSALCSN